MHPIENLMKSSIEQIKEMVDVNTIVGAPIKTSGETMILPVSKVSLGFLSGGGEYGTAAPVKESGKNEDAQDARFPFAGTAVAGMSLTPQAFLYVNNGVVNVIPAHYDCSFDRIIEQLPTLLASFSRPKKSERVN
ncbi:MAG: GerW family sporulation protein [Clostridia bacterium]